MTGEAFDVVVVGAGHAGTTLATELAGGGYTGTVALVGAEDTLPYERPPLSKGFLLGTTDEEGLLLRDRAYWGESPVRLLLGRTVVRIDPQARTADCADGSRIGYGVLVWAAGGDARRLGARGEPGPGVHTLRSLQDARELRAVVGSAPRFVVVGGGFVGLEATAVLARSGSAVTVLEQQERLLTRVTGETVSDWFLRRHRAEGVDVRLGAAVAAVERREEVVTGVALTTGEVVPADRVLVAVGLVPAVAPLVEAGAAGGDGVDVDAHGRTSLPGILAVGDCARFPFERHPNGRTRLESIQNATEQARSVARGLLGGPEPYDPQPWFWSNQYDVRFRTVGVAAGHDTAVVRGDPDTDTFSVVYLHGRRVLAVDTVNAMKEYVGARALVGRTGDLGRIADPSVPLKNAVIIEAGSAAGR